MYIAGSNKSFGLVLGIILIAFGIIFLVAPDRVAEIIAILVGGLITAVGFFRLATLISRWHYISDRVYILIVSLLIFGAGLYILFNPNRAIALIGIVIGFFAIFMAIDRFITANRLKREINVLPTIITGLIHLAFGIGMIYSAVVVFSIIIVIIGIYLLLAGVMVTLSTFYFRDY